MQFSAMYWLRWYRRAFTCYGASNKCGVGKTRYFRAKCVNITHHQISHLISLVCNLFSCRIGAIFGMFSRHVGLLASAGLSCLFISRQVRMILMSQIVVMVV